MINPPAHPVLRIVLAVLVGIVVLFVVQILVTRLWGAADIQWSGTNLPLAPGQQWAALSTLFIAVLASTVGAAWTAGERAAHAVLILVIIGMGVDGFAMFAIVGNDLPLWFRAAFVSQIPLASLLGFLLIRPRLFQSLKGAKRN